MLAAAGLPRLDRGMSIPAALPDRLDRIASLWLVGCGAMGGTLLGRWIAAGLDPRSVTVIDPQPGAIAGAPAVTSVATPAEAAAGPPPELVVLGVKPQIVAAVASALQPALPQRPLLLSMLAGVRTGTLGQLFPGARLVRIMPNTPARVGKGVTAMFGAGLGPGDSLLAEALARAAGTLLWLDDEHRFDAVTALSGSGPAFLFRFIEALAGAGESVGLDPATAAALASQTVVGAAALVELGEAGPALLRQQVTSPNGVTEAGLDVLDGDGALSSLLRATLRAASERSRALAAAAEATTSPVLPGAGRG